MSTDTLQIAPGAEAFKCQDVKNPVGTDVAIVYSHSTMSVGSHHMLLFRDPAFNADAPAADCSGLELHDYVHLAQAPDVTWTYPDKVGRSLKGADGLRFAVHYLNAGTDSISAHVDVQFSYVDPNTLTYLAAPIFLNQTLLLVPTGASIQTRQFVVPYDIQMLRAVGHMHSRGVKFTATASTGEEIYEGTSWEEPVERVFNPPMKLGAGTTITWNCSFENDTGLTLTFGESAMTNEMCILYGLFFPADPSANQGVTIGSLI